MDNTPNDPTAIPVGLGTLSHQRKRMTMAGVLLAMFMSSLDNTIVGTAMPRIVADLGGFGQYTLISSVYIIAAAIVMPITGRLTDMYGRKPFYIAGLSIFIASSAGCGLSQTIAQMVVWRGVKGIGAGVMMATGFTVIGDLFPPAQRGRYIGIGSAIFGFAAIIGPILGGFITDRFSWPWVFYINIPLGIVVIVLFARYFPYFRPDFETHRIDIAGILTLIITVLSFMLLLAWGGNRFPWFSGPVIGIAAFTVAMLSAFIWIESICEEPIIPLQLFSNSIVVISLSVTFLCGFSMFGSVVFIPLFFQGVIGDSATASGTILTPMMLGVIAGSSLSGYLMSRTGGHYKLQGIAGLVLMGVGMWSLSRMNAATGTAYALINVSLTGLGLGITLPLYTIATQNAVPYRLLGVATSATPFFRSLGGACGLAILGAVMHSRFTTELTGGLVASLKETVPLERLLEMANNPQILVDVDRQRQLEASLSQLLPGGAGADVFRQLLQGLRRCLESALSMTFLAALSAIILSFAIHLFIKEIPLREKHD